MTLLAILLLGLQERAISDAQCIACHVDQADEVKDTMHQKAGVGCVSCHGTDEIVNDKHRKTASFRPGRLPQVAALCGECHKGVLEAFLPSEHFAAASKDDGEPNHRSSCSACHDYHATPKADAVTILKSCLPCHEENSHEVREAEALFRSLASASGGVTRFQRALERLERRPGIALFDLKAAAEDAHRDLRQIRVAQHGLKWSRLKGEMAASAARTAAAYNTLAAREESFARRFLGLGLFLGLLALCAVLIARRSRSLQGAT